MKGLLDEIVILDLTRFLSGPYCTLLLSGLGAEVIKLDDPATGDPTAHASPYAVDQGVAFERTSESQLGLAYLKRARGKQSATLNLKSEAGRTLFLRLVERADVVVENFRPGVAQRLGIDYPTLAVRNARLVYCAISGLGATGPDKDQKSFDLMAQAASGMMAITGEPNGPPTKIGSAFSDMVAGTYAALGIVAALQEREHSGFGQAIDVSMIDCLFAMMMDEPFDRYGSLGLPERQGNRVMRLSPFNAYQTLDGWVVIGAASQQDWERLCGAMGRGDLETHPDFSRNAWRIAHNDQVDAVVSGWVSKLNTDEVLSQLLALDVPSSPVRSAQDVLQWPHLQARNMISPLRNADGTPASAAAADLPLRFSRSTAGHTRPAPVPGTDTNQVLQRLLNLTDKDMETFRQSGVI